MHNDIKYLLININKNEIFNFFDNQIEKYVNKI